MTPSSESRSKEVVDFRVVILTTLGLVVVIVVVGLLFAKVVDEVADFAVVILSPDFVEDVLRCAVVEGVVALGGKIIELFHNIQTPLRKTP